MRRYYTSQPHGLADMRPGNNTAAQRLHHFGPIQPMQEERKGLLERLFRKGTV